MRKSVLWSAAFHEAGHAVACQRLGLGIRSATIVPTRDYAGQVVHCDPWRGINLEWDNSAPGDRRAKAVIIMYLAGPEALRRYSPRSWRSVHGASDRAKVVDQALRVNGSDRATQAYVRWLEIVTRDFVAVWWPWIEKVAHALFERRSFARAAKRLCC